MRTSGRMSRISSLWLRGVTYGLITLLLASLPVILALTVTGDAEINWTAGLAGKILFGAAVAAIVTPVALRSALCEMPADDWAKNPRQIR